MITLTHERLHVAVTESAQAVAARDAIENDLTFAEITLRLDAEDPDGRIAKIVTEGIAKNATAKTFNICITHASDEKTTAVATSLTNHATIEALMIVNAFCHAAGRTTMTKALASMKALKRLHIWNPWSVYDTAGLGVDIAALLSNCKSLETLYFHDVFLQDHGERGLRDGLMNTSSLKSLDLSQLGIEGAGATLLGEGLAKNATLETLRLYGNRIGDVGAKGLAKGVANHPALQKLNVARNNIGPEGFEALGNALTSEGTLITLEMAENRPGVLGCVALADGIGRSSSLRTLVAWMCELGPDEATALSCALQTTKTLRLLDVSHNPLGDEGVEAIAKEMERNSTLHELILHATNFEDGGAIALGRMLEMNTTLTKLSVTSNLAADSGRKALGEGIAVNETLRELDMNNTWREFTPHYPPHIEAGIARRTMNPRAPKLMAIGLDGKVIQREIERCAVGLVVTPRLIGFDELRRKIENYI